MTAEILRTFSFMGEIPFEGETPRELVGYKEHALYRFYDGDGDLLYVGISWSPWRRWKQHRAKSPWFGSATRVTCDVYPNEWTALDAERAAIRNELPCFNTRSAPRKATAQCLAEE